MSVRNNSNSALTPRNNSNSLVATSLVNPFTGSNYQLPSGTTLADTSSAQTFTTKTLISPIISTITNGGNLTLPTVTDNLVARTSVDTLSNKTLASPVINTPTINVTGGLLTIPNGPTTLVDLSSTQALSNKSFTGALNITGLTTCSSGVQYGNSSGTGTTSLIHNAYEEATVTIPLSSTCWGSLSPLSFSFKFIKNGNQVTMSFPNITGGIGTGGSAGFITGIIPTRFKPTQLSVYWVSLVCVREQTPLKRATRRGETQREAHQK